FARQRGRRSNGRREAVLPPRVASLLLEVELESELQHARSHDLLYAAEIGDGQPGRIERGLTRVAAGDRSVADLSRAGVERVMQLDDERCSTRAVDLEVLV